MMPVTAAPVPHQACQHRRQFVAVVDIRPARHLSAPSPHLQKLRRCKGAKVQSCKAADAKNGSGAVRQPPSRRCRGSTNIYVTAAELRYGGCRFPAFQVPSEPFGSNLIATSNLGPQNIDCQYLGSIMVAFYRVETTQ
jgi:hypothetical protein